MSIEKFPSTEKDADCLSVQRFRETAAAILETVIPGVEDADAAPLQVNFHYEDAEVVIASFPDETGAPTLYVETSTQLSITSDGLFRVIERANYFDDEDSMRVTKRPVLQQFKVTSADPAFGQWEDKNLLTPEVRKKIGHIENTSYKTYEQSDANLLTSILKSLKAEQ